MYKYSGTDKKTTNAMTVGKRQNNSRTVSEIHTHSHSDVFAHLYTYMYIHAYTVNEHQKTPSPIDSLNAVIKNYCEKV